MKKIKLSQGKHALVDSEDFEYLSQWKWCAEKRRHTFYAVRSQWIGGKTKKTSMHRLLARTPRGMDTDHLNGNGLDNRKANLRSATRKENLNAHRAKLQGIQWDFKK